VGGRAEDNVGSRQHQQCDTGVKGDSGAERPEAWTRGKAGHGDDVMR